MMAGPRRMTGLELILALVGILLLTAVVPPVSAWLLNRSRVNDTVSSARTIVADLNLRIDDVAATVEKSGLAVVCGPGRLPEHDPAGLWVTRALQVPTVLGDDLPTDGWGQCFLMNVEALRDSTAAAPVWVISAGPNGTVETHPAARQPDGDDIGVRLR